MLEGSEELNRTLDEYLRVAVRRRWWLLLPACLVALASVGLSLFVPILYRSEVVFLVEEQKVPQHYVIPNVDVDLRNRLQTMTQQILSRARLLQIIDESGLYAKEKKRRTPEELAELMRKRIEIELIEGDPRRQELNAFKISFSGEDPRVAQAVTGRLTSLFVEESLRAREQQALSTTHFLQAQLETARQELLQQEKRLGEFKTRYLGELPEQQAGNLTILAGLQMQHQAAVAALDRARQQRVYLESLLPQYQSLALAGGALPGSAASPATSMEAELARLRNERAALLARYTPKHPDIRRMDEQIGQAEALKAQLATQRKAAAEQPGAESELPAGSPTAAALAQTKSQLEANKLEIDSLVAAEKRIQGEINKYHYRLNLTPLREQQLADVIRDHNLSKQNYEELLKKKMESELATNMEKRQQGEQFRVLDPPSLPARPYRFNRLRMNLAGGGLGLALAVGLAYLIEVRDRSLHTEKDLYRLVPLPLVVGVPEFLTATEERHRWKKRCGEWVAGAALVLAVVVAELLANWRGLG